MAIIRASMKRSRHILDGSYKGIGFDVIGLDPIADENLPRHKALFREKDIVNIENLKNLGQCGTGAFLVRVPADEDRGKRRRTGTGDRVVRGLKRISRKGG